MPDANGVVTVKQLTLAGAAIIGLFGSTIGYLEVQESKRDALRDAAYSAVMEQMDKNREELDSLTAFTIERMDKLRAACKVELDLRDQRLFKALGFEDVEKQ